MTRATFVLLLVDLVSNGHLRATEARVVLSLYDAGQLPDLPIFFGPADPRQADDWNVAWLALLLLLGVGVGTRLISAQRQRGQRLLRTRFEFEAQQLAVAVALGQRSVVSWQAGMTIAVTNYSRQMAVAGAGGLPSAAVQQTVTQRIASQTPFLARFGTQILARKVVGRAMGMGAIAQRAEKYGGTGWGAYYAGQGSNALYGYVEQWITKDDRGVCPRCGPRHLQFYLPGRGPMPGWDCLGSCRCKRVLVYDLAQYLTLTRAAPPTPAQSIPTLVLGSRSRGESL